MGCRCDDQVARPTGPAAGLLPGRWLAGRLSRQVGPDGEASFGLVVQVPMRSVDGAISRGEITVPVIIMEPRCARRASAGSPCHLGTPSCVLAWESARIQACVSVT